MHLKMENQLMSGSHVYSIVDDTTELILAVLLLLNMVLMILIVVALMICKRESSFNIELILFINFKVSILFP